VKEKVEAEHKMAADMMKLISYGKVMDDGSKTLKDYSIKEGDFLVVMVSKVRIKFINFQSGKTSSQGRRPQKRRSHPVTAIASGSHHHFSECSPSTTDLFLQSGSSLSPSKSSSSS
jgi:hypothetical protein